MLICLFVLKHNLLQSHPPLPLSSPILLYLELQMVTRSNNSHLNRTWLSDAHICLFPPPSPPPLLLLPLSLCESVLPLFCVSGPLVCVFFCIWLVVIRCHLRIFLTCLPHSKQNQNKKPSVPAERPWFWCLHDMNCALNPLGVMKTRIHVNGNNAKDSLVTGASASSFYLCSSMLLIKNKKC